MLRIGHIYSLILYLLIQAKIKYKRDARGNNRGLWTDKDFQEGGNYWRYLWQIGARLMKMIY